MMKNSLMSTTVVVVVVMAMVMMMTTMTMVAAVAMAVVAMVVVATTVVVVVVMAVVVEILDMKTLLAEALTNLNKGIHKLRPSSTKVKDPDSFDGSSPQKLCEFLVVCNLIFSDHPDSFQRDEKKVCFISQRCCSRLV
jgi:hypothetical protein